MLITEVDEMNITWTYHTEKQRLDESLFIQIISSSESSNSECYAASVGFVGLYEYLHMK